MADPERRRKLEEIRRKKLMLQSQLNAKSNKADKTDEQSVTERAKEVLKEAQKTAEIPTMPAQKDNFMTELIKKRFNQSLGETKISEFFMGTKPELYDETVQCEEAKENDSEEDNDNNEKKQIQKKSYEALIIRKHHVQPVSENKDQPFDNRPKVYTVIPEEQRKEYLDKKKEE